MPAAASSSELARAAEAMVGTELDGRYRIEALVGAGGMGAVFRAHHRFLEQTVAIKVLRPHLARDPIAARRFVREARGTHAVASDHAVKVLDCAATEDGLPYIVLEFLDGRTVADELRADGPLAPRRAVRIARRACEALSAAHRVGILHRDLKPENLMLVRRGADPDHVKVLDFGLAKAMEGAGEQALSMAALTQGGVVFGTPDYMAPEQALGHTLDARCDLYALGATLFEMLTGQPPFPAASPLAVLAAHVRKPPPHLADLAPALAEAGALDALVQACLAKAPDDRPASAAELAERLAAVEASLGGAAVALSATASLPALPLAPSSELAASDDPGSAPWPAARRRSPWLWLAVGAVLFGAAVLAVGWRSRRGASRSGRAAVAATAPVDAGVDGAPVDAAPPMDAAVDAAPRARTPSTARDEDLAMHLDAARAAKRAGNRLRQLAEADAALTLAPANRTARYLVGDALVGAGDLARGCPYLRGSRLPAASARADAVGCP